MSTGLKRSHSEAKQDALDFIALFPGCWETWTIAGSVRRLKPEVADIEHVVIPRNGMAKANGLFGEPVECNLLWNRMDELVDNGTLTKHVYGETGNRWGKKYRGVDFRGFNHEIFTATPDNYGAILAIRTGPAEYSQMLVTVMRDRGLQMVDGAVKYVRHGSIYKTPTEESFFTAAGIQYTEPKDRR